MKVTSDFVKISLLGVLIVLAFLVNIDYYTTKAHKVDLLEKRIEKIEIALKLKDVKL